MKLFFEAGGTGKKSFPLFEAKLPFSYQKFIRFF
jgi:hypothetical protein